MRADPIEAVDRVHALPDVDEVEHHEVRVAVLHERRAVGRVLQNPAAFDLSDSQSTYIVFMQRRDLRLRSVSPWALYPVRQKNPVANGQDVHVEVVVDQIELLARRERARRAVDLARELRVGGIECVLPDLCIFN